MASRFLDYEGLKQVAQLVNNKIRTVGNGGYVVVQQLPTASAATVGKIYLLPTTGDTYERWITYDTGSGYQWVSVGSTDIDLSNYAKKDGSNVTAFEAMTLSAQDVYAHNRLYADYVTTSTLYNPSGLGITVPAVTKSDQIALESELVRLRRDIGYNETSTVVTLQAGETGKYVKCATRVATANSSFAISKPFTVDACSELLIKTGFNPSDSSHSALDLSVISFVHEIERQRMVQKVDGSGNPLYYVVVVDEETGQESVTTEESTEVSSYPVYTTETYTDVVYTPNNEDKYVAIPDSGYYVANIPDSARVVVSYKPGVTDTKIIIVKHGAFANIVSQLGMLAFKERLPVVQALAQLKEELDGLKKLVGENLQDRNQIPTVMGVPLVVYGHGVPAEGTVPVNWPDGRLWDGVPHFEGQVYVNLDAGSAGAYFAKGHESVGDWMQG